MDKLEALDIEAAQEILMGLKQKRLLRVQSRRLPSPRPKYDQIVLFLRLLAATFASQGKTENPQSKQTQGSRLWNLGDRCARTGIIRVPKGY